MPRLRSPITGVVVNVSDDKAARMGSGWAVVEDAAEPEKKTARRTTKK